MYRRTQVNELHRFQKIVKTDKLFIIEKGKYDKKTEVEKTSSR